MNREKSLWIFNQYAVTPNLPGGTRHYDFGRELVSYGYQVVIFAASFHYHLRREIHLQSRGNLKIEDVNGVKFVWLRTPYYWRNDWRRVQNMMVYTLRAWWFAKKIPCIASELRSPDIIIGSSPHLLAPLAAYWVAQYYHVPFVMEVRDLWPQTIVDIGEFSPHHPIVIVLQKLESFLYNKARLVITLLPLAHEYIGRYGISREKIVWIPNGVDLSRYGKYELITPPNKNFKVMYVGAHGRTNALDVIIQAAKIIQEEGFYKIRFILVGDGPEKPRLIQLAKDLKVKNVEFYEPIPKAEVTKILQKADVLLFTLEKADVFKYGISSNKLFDYMAVGKPLISSVKTLANPVEEAQCGITIAPRNPQDLAEAVLKLYQMSPEEREAMGQRGRRYVEQHHDIRKLALQLEKVLQSIL